VVTRRKAPYVPDRGDIVWMVFDPQAGHEQSGRRPALIVSSKEYNGKRGLALLCPVTSKVKGYPFEVALPLCAKVSGAVLCDQIKSADWRARKAKFIERIDKAACEDVVGKLHALLEI